MTDTPDVVVPVELHKSKGFLHKSQQKKGKYRNSFCPHCHQERELRDGFLICDNCTNGDIPVNHDGTIVTSESKEE